MKTKFLIPVLAIIFAVGMSFTTVDLGDKAASDFIKISDTQWMPIPEVNCGSGPEICKATLPDGSTHLVYDTPNSTSPRDSNSKVPFEVEL